MDKSFTTRFRAILTAAAVFLLIVSCSKSGDQRQFEQEAFTVPQNITATDAHGAPIPDRNDPDDWRIGPMFGGLVAVGTPAWPNPVPVNTTFRIELDIRGIESVSGLEVWAFAEPDRLMGPVFMEDEHSLAGGLYTITLSSNQFHNPTTALTDLYRILIYDGNENLITYGDVQVE